MAKILMTFERGGEVSATLLQDRAPQGSRRYSTPPANSWRPAYRDETISPQTSYLCIPNAETPFPRGDAVSQPTK